MTNPVTLLHSQLKCLSNFPCCSCALISVFLTAKDTVSKMFFPAWSATRTLADSLAQRAHVLFLPGSRRPSCPTSGVNTPGDSLRNPSYLPWSCLLSFLQPQTPHILGAALTFTAQPSRHPPPVHTHLLSVFQRYLIIPDSLCPFFPYIRQIQI